MMNSIRTLLLSGLLIGAAWPVGQEQEPPPFRFGVRVEFVEVDAKVIDGDEKFVSDLQCDDFELFEDGHLQELSRCVLVDLTTVTPPPQTAFPDVAPSVVSNQYESPGRIYILLLDDLHTAPQRSVAVRNSARRFIEENLAEGDVAAVVHTSGRAAQELTANRGRLLEAVELFMGSKLRSATLEMVEKWRLLNPGARAQEERLRAEGRTEGSRIQDPFEQERELRAQTVTEQLRKLAGALGELPGRRKSVLYFGEGFENDAEDVLKGQASFLRVDDMIEAAREANRSNVSVYAVDPRGLSSVSASLIELPGVPMDFPNAMGVGSLQSVMQNEYRLSQDNLRGLSEETGGFAVLNSNDLASGLDRIVEDASRYYMLGYYPTETSKVGYRRIEVRVKRPGLRVDARRGYIVRESDAETVESAGASPDIVRLASSPLAVSDISLRAAVSPLRSGVVLLIEASIDGFRFEERDAELHDSVELYAVALDEDGNPVREARRNFVLSLPLRTHTIMARSGLRMGMVLDLSPGTYQVRVAAIEKGGGRRGSLFHDLVVPEAQAPGLSLSPIVVTTDTESQIPVLAAEEDQRSVWALPSTRSAFSRRDELWILSEIDWEDEVSELSLSTTLQSPDGTLVFESTPDDINGRRLRQRIPLSGIPTGEYLLEVKAEASSGHGETFRRATIQIQ
jgi:VWFA-related protein